MDQAKWTTIGFFRAWCDVVMADMIVCGIAVPNEEFDPEKLYDIMFHVTDPDVFEWEQKGFTLGSSREWKMADGKATMLGVGGNGEYVAKKSNMRWT